MRRAGSRSLIFGAVVVVCLIGAAGYVAWAALRGDSGSDVSTPAAPLARVSAKPHLVYQSLEGRVGDAGYSRVALAELDDPRDGSEVVTSLACDRIYFAAGHGLCLTSDEGPFKTAYKVSITGADFKTRHTLELAGIPSRARVSPDGRIGATTAFVRGHSYAPGTFSTQTLLIDMARGKKLADLERDFAVTRDGKRVKEVDFNFWGVTFARDSNRFYATLATGGKTNLIEGDVRARRARILRQNAECPSISPDNTRLVYKKRVPDRWRFHVLDLRTGVETPLAEKHGIDDQVEWLDNSHVLYGSRPATVWVVPADGSGTPRKFLSGGLSPSVVRNRDSLSTSLTEAKTKRQGT